jgi:hypothetical protein
MKHANQWLHAQTDKNCSTARGSAMPRTAALPPTCAEQSNVGLRCQAWLIGLVVLSRLPTVLPRLLLLPALIIAILRIFKLPIAAVTPL